MSQHQSCPITPDEQPPESSHLAPEPDRDSYHAFWREVTDATGAAYSETSRRYVSTTDARTALAGISRGVGVELTADVMQQLRDARSRSIS